MRNLAVIALLVSGCGGEAFESDLFTSGEKDGGTPIPVQETGPVVQPDAAPIHEDAAPARESGPGEPDVPPPCRNHYLELREGQSEPLSCPNLSLPFRVSGRFRLEPGDSELRIERDGPENPCGWSLTVRGSQVKATVPALFDHFVQVDLVGTGWRTVEWLYDGELSKLFVDGTQVAVSVKPRGTWPFPACSGPASAEGSGDVDDVSVQGQTWNFDEQPTCE